MKTGLQSCSLDGGYGRWGADAYRKMKEHGYSCCDFNMSETDKPLYTLPQEESDAILLRERALAQAAGIEIIQAHGPWRYPPRDYTGEDRAERMEKMKKSIRAAHLLGCPNWIVHPIMPYGVKDTLSGDAEKTWGSNLAFMRELLKTAEEYGVTICLENMPMRDFSIATPEQILKFVREIDSDRFKVCLDTGHVSVFPGLSVGDEIRRLGKELRTLHVHDNRHGYDMHLMPFLGVIDWQDAAAALREIGFDGAFSLETLPPEDLPAPVYEDLARCFARIAAHIVSD